jgi:hypothetical protein
MRAIDDDLGEEAAEAPAEIPVESPPVQLPPVEQPAAEYPSESEETPPVDFGGFSGAPLQEQEVDPIYGFAEETRHQEHDAENQEPHFQTYSRQP